ncbi:MAG: IS200/IS605 family transposase [Anaerolineaceae bacterium]|nr:IS200/IS605 family transposase [Anaerolineaceae bacterium]
MNYKNNKGSHSIYNLQFHYVACVKYRRKVLTDAVSARLKEIILSVAAKEVGVAIIEQETDRDHIHILISTTPQIQLSKFINSLKSVSARLLFREFPELRKTLWGGAFWSPSYFIASTGQVTLDVLKRYVENQNAKDL